MGPGYDPTKTLYAPDIINMTYEGTWLKGYIGWETVSVGGFKIDDVEVTSISEKSEGYITDGAISGVIGLGPDPVCCIMHTPLFTTMWKRKTIAPVFSLALNRPGEEAGRYSLGSEIEGTVRHSKVWASAKFRSGPIAAGQTDQEKLESEIADATRNRNEKPNPKYVIVIDGFDLPIGGAEKWNSNSVDAAIDSGEQYVILPLAMSAVINLQWQGANATFDAGNMRFAINCKATAYRLGLRFGTQKIFVEPEDMVIRTGGGCYSAIMGSKSNTGSLGGSFLRSVVAVFDVGKGEMRFAQRERS
jgi:aspergillopepsin I